ncbi:MAG: T9SS type A sorting domain-containing protein [Bacteroidetes bacterium]|nr:T9SS type A sorting domain-containing protein [Bacteroidota bacterium]
MKKLLLTMSAITLVFTGVFAQQLEVHPELGNVQVTNKTHIVSGSKHQVTSRGANDVSTWYNFLGSYKEGTLLGQSLKSYANFIWPDTTGYVVYSDGTKSKMGFHVWGSTFDPKDTNYAATGETVLTKFNPYTLDSLQFLKFYVRQLDSFDFGAGKVEVIDTAYIQYYDITGLDVKTFVYTSQIPKVTYYAAYPKEAGFSTKSLLNSTAIKTDTILLDKSWADSVDYNGANTSFFGSYVILAPGLTSKSTNTLPVTNNLMAYSITYKPMRKTNLGDTLIAYDGSTWSKKFNMFGLQYQILDQHDQLITTPYRINNTFVSNFEVRYGQSIGSVFKSYIPGTIFSSTLFQNVYWHITTSNLSNKEFGNNGITGAAVYPNPASANSSVDVAFSLNKSSDVITTITDLNGKVVKAFGAKTFGAGTHTMNLNTQELSKGMYLVILEGSAGKTTAKLSIQ